jgi:putative acetyltransferase
MTMRVIDLLEGNAKLSDSDVQRISDLSIIASKEANKGAYPPEELDLFISFMAPKYLKNRFERCYTVLIEEGEELIASGILGKEPNESFSLKRVYVLPERRGEGIGTQIMDELERKAKEIGLDRLYFGALPFPGTLRFYENRGYKVIREQFWKYGDITLKEIMMEKTIK